MSEQNQTDYATQTKQCTECGETITRKLNHRDSHWESVRKCDMCRKTRYHNSRGCGGNEFWTALAVGEIPQELQAAYRNKKKEVRAAAGKEWSEIYNRKYPLVSQHQFGL